MSEERAVYAGETPEETRLFIRDESPHDHYSQIPNIVDDMHLSPYAYRLYGHLRRVAGEAGKCWQSTTTLAAACDMSTGKISDAKRELENTYPPLIRIVSKVADGKTYHEIAVTDIWTLNHQHFTGETVHHTNPSKDRSPHERDRSPHETKKNPIKKNSLKKDIPPPDLQGLPVSEYRKIPEIRLFMDATKWIPGSFVLETVYEFVHAGLTEKQIADAFKAWCARGYRAANVQGYLEWARDGIPPAKGNYGNKNNTASSPRPAIQEPDDATSAAARIVLAQRAQASAAPT